MNRVGAALLVAAVLSWPLTSRASVHHGFRGPGHLARTHPGTGAPPPPPPPPAGQFFFPTGTNLILAAATL